MTVAPSTHREEGEKGSGLEFAFAVFPFAGAGVTAAKFGRKAVNTIAKNADHIDEVGDGIKAAKKVCEDANCFVAGTQVVVAVAKTLQGTPDEPLEPEASDEEVNVVTDATAETLTDETASNESPIDTAAEAPGMSVTFLAAGLALAVVRHTWTSSPPPNAPAKSNRRQARSSKAR